MQSYHVLIEGTTPLMCHKMTEETIRTLLFKGKGKKKKTAASADDESPREVAEKHAYKTDTGEYVIPSSYFAGAFINASSDYKQTSSSKKSMKSLAAGAFRPVEEYAQLLCHQNQPLKTFEVDIRTGVNHLKGRVAVCRPRFEKWRAKFTVSIDEDLIPQSLALQILEDSGRRVGVGSFRISNRGPFGGFNVIEWTKVQ